MSEHMPMHPMESKGEYLKKVAGVIIAYAVAAPGIALGFYGVYRLVTLIGNS